MVALLPLHTVFVPLWVSWKPFLLIALILGLWDLIEAVRTRTWPYARRPSAAVALFLAVAAIGFPAAEYRERFVRLLLALVVGAGVMLVSERRLRYPGMIDASLRVVFWTTAAMGLTAVGFSVIALGVLGNDPINLLAEPPPFRFFKPAYLRAGFIALSNWHQDPGYSAAWSVLWGVLALFASLRGLGTRRWWLDGMVVGGIWFASVMAFARTGWISFPLALVVTVVLVHRRRLAPLAQVGKRVGVAAVSMVLLVAAMFAIDVENVGGDLDLQFAFRFRQGWDLLADLTGLFSSSEAFEDRFDVSEERADVWPEYLAMFRREPITGVGLGVGWESNSAHQEPHNLVLQLLAETGLLGAAAFLLVLVVVVGTGGGALGAAALTASFLHSLTQTVLFEPTWWFAAALLMAGEIGKSDPLA